MTSAALDGERVFVPAGLATDGETLWVGDWATGVVSVIADGLETGFRAPAGLPPTYAFSGVVVAPSGAVYASGTGVLYRLARR